jgi:hypothetical protein
MPKIKNLAALAAAIEAARRYARSNPDKAAKYLDQAAAFVDKQTKGKYTTKVDGVVKQVKGVAGLPQTSRTQGYGTNPGYGAHQGYGPTPSTTPTTPSTPASSSTAPLSTPPVGDQQFPGSKDL